MSECTHDCGSCSSSCSERTTKESFLEKPNAKSKIKKVIGVISGKGGVGKSLVTGMMSVLMSRDGGNVAVMDADITGPSIPKMFGLNERAVSVEDGILPVKTAGGIGVMSINLLLENPTDPVIWRGPVIAGVVKQFWTDVIWGDVDYMFVDMPPGTGDVPLTVFQSIPLDGVIIVTSPQDLVSMVVAKAVAMAKLMEIPILGFVENMSYVECPDCGKKIMIYGESHIEKIAENYNVPMLGKIPVAPEITAACDSGSIEAFNGNWLEEAVKAVKAL